jgi:hypothetical protein
MYAYFLGSKLRYWLAGTYAHPVSEVPKEISLVLEALLDTRADTFPGRRVAYIGSKRKVSKASRTMSMLAYGCAKQHRCINVQDWDAEWNGSLQSEGVMGTKEDRLRECSTKVLKMRTAPQTFDAKVPLMLLNTEGLLGMRCLATRIT